MKLKFTKLGKLLHEALNKAELDYTYYHKEYQDIIDVGMYINNCYVDNNFSNIKKFTDDINESEHEYKFFSNRHKKHPYNKIKRMIDKEIIKIIL